MFELNGRSNNLFTNFLDGLERDGCSRTLSLLKIFCRPSRPVIRRSDNVFKTRWTYYKRNCRTSILLGTCCDVVQSGINWKYVFKPTPPFVACFPRSQTGAIRPTASLVHCYSDQMLRSSYEVHSACSTIIQSVV